MKKEYLISKAYTYYPIGLYDGDSNYVNSTEYQHLGSIRRNIPVFLKNWQELINTLELLPDFKDFIIEDWSETIAIDQCLRFLIIFNDKDTPYVNQIKLVVNLSILIPYYIIHQSISTPDSRILHAENYNSVSFNIPDRFMPIDKLLKVVISNHFPGYNLLKPELTTVEIDDITSNGLGVLKINEHQPFLKKMTVYNAFFSNSYL